APRPLMLWAPRDDIGMPPEGVDRFLEVARPAYQRADAIDRLVVHRPPGEHAMTIESFEAAYQFFEEFLKGKQNSLRDGRGSVTIRNVDTNEPRSIVTNAEGIYTITNLSPGNYELIAEKEGFRTHRESGIVLSTQKNRGPIWRSAKRHGLTSRSADAVALRRF